VRKAGGDKSRFQVPGGGLHGRAERGGWRQSHAQKREGGEAQAFGVELRNGQLEPIALIKGMSHLGARRLRPQCGPNRVDVFEDDDLVGFVFVCTWHGGKRAKS
jgi:hypothetical protein